MRKLLLVICISVPFLSSARMPGFLSNFELGYSYATATANYRGANPYYDGDGIYLRDTTISKTAKSKYGYGAFIGTYLPFKRLGEHSSVGLDITLGGNAYVWTDFFTGYSVTGDEISLSGGLGGVSEQIYVPIGIDFKIGCNAVGVKNHRFTASVGAGVQPSMNVTIAEAGLGDFGGGLAFSAIPYVKGEVGVFWGICWKLRLMTGFGSVPLIDNDKSLLAGSASGFLKVTGKTMTQASIIIMPFSWGWKKEGWWNTANY